MVGNLYTITFFLALCVMGCAVAPTNEEDITEEKAVMETKAENTEGQAINEEADVIISTELWQKKPGTPTYDEKGAPIGSLRFTPKVFVYEIKGDWLKIEDIKQIWVKRSDLTLEKPDTMLEVPENSNMMPRVYLPSSSDDVK